MCNHLFSEEILLDLQPELPVVQLVATSSCPLASCLGAKTDLYMATFASFEAVAERDKVSPDPSLLQAKETQLPHLLLMYVHKYRYTPDLFTEHLVLCLLG